MHQNVGNEKKEKSSSANLLQLPFQQLDFERVLES